MRATTWGFSLLGVVVAGLVLSGCSGGASQGGGCQRDSDCGSGFCDRGACQQPAEVYGSACTPAPLGPDGVRDGAYHTCGAYLCLEDRCRSCSSDQECQAELGSPRCLQRESRPGRRCGAPAP